MSFSVHEKYPRRLSVRGRVSRETKSLNHFCALGRIAGMRDFIGADAYDDIKNSSQVGVILHLAEANFAFQGGKHVQHLLSNMLQTSMTHEVWVLADGRPIRFSLHEFEHITHLNCGLFESNDGDMGYEELWTDLGLNFGEGPNWPKLSVMLRGCRDWTFAKRKMLGLLVVLQVGIFGFHPNGRLPFSEAILVTDPERFERHPWGRVAFYVLIRSILHPCLPQVPLRTLHGLVPVLVVWAFEHIPGLGEMCGNKISGDNVIPLLQWSTSSARGIRLQDVIEADKHKTADKKDSSKREAAENQREVGSANKAKWKETNMNVEFERLK